MVTAAAVSVVDTDSAMQVSGHSPKLQEPCVWPHIFEAEQGSSSIFTAIAGAVIGSRQEGSTAFTDKRSWRHPSTCGWQGQGPRSLDRLPHMISATPPLTT